MIQNKATRLNKTMLFGTVIMGIIVLGCVFGMLYLSFDKTMYADSSSERYSITFGEQALGDSMAISLNGTLLFSGTASSDTVISADVSPEQNMLSVSDLSDNESLNSDIPCEPVKIVVNKADGQITIETTAAGQAE